MNRKSCKRKSPNFALNVKICMDTKPSIKCVLNVSRHRKLKLNCSKRNKKQILFHRFLKGAFKATRKKKFKRLKRNNR